MNENDFEEESENNINENEIEIESIGDSIIKDLRLYKVIIIGDSKVGKTSISYRALKNELMKIYPQILFLMCKIIKLALIIKTL